MSESPGPVPRGSANFLRTELRRAVESHRPDRTAMLNRIATNRAADRAAERSSNRALNRAVNRALNRAVNRALNRTADLTAERAAGRTADRAADRTGDGAGGAPRGRALRPAGSALAVMAVLGLGGVVKWALADDHNPPPVAVAPPSAAPPATPASSLASAVATSKPPSRTRTQTTPASSSPVPSVSPVRGHPGDTQVLKGSLSSAGKLVGQGESDVTITAAADLTEFEMTIRVIATPGLVAAGGTSSTDDVTVAVSPQAGAFLYRYTLKAGATLEAGTYTFGAAYDGGGGRDPAGDTYEAYATSVEHKRIHIYGNFLPRD